MGRRVSLPAARGACIETRIQEMIKHPQSLEAPLRTVSRRLPGENALSDAAILLRTVNRLRGTGIVPRGVYRFASHEEADTWMMRQMACSPVRRSLKIS